MNAPPEGHGLHGQSRGVIHVVRLLPGEDLLEALQSFIRRKEISAAVIVTCVGSTGETVLRPAGKREGKHFDGKHEIVSLTGTLSAGGHHLHMSISDENCCVVGGHVLKGCTVRTTAEVALAELPALKFLRPQDSRTGFSELSVRPSSGSAGNADTDAGLGGAVILLGGAVVIAISLVAHSLSITRTRCP